MTWQAYTLKKGETLEKVASQVQHRSAPPARESTASTRRKRVQPGQMLLVPLEQRRMARPIWTKHTATPTSRLRRKNTARRVRYRVRSGDTLSSIARKHHTSVARIKAINSLKSNQLHVGQKLVIYQDSRPVRRTASLPPPRPPREQLTSPLGAPERGTGPATHPLP